MDLELLSIHYTECVLRLGSCVTGFIMFCGAPGISGLSAGPPLLRALPLASGGTRLGGWSRGMRHDMKTEVNRPTMSF